MDWAQVSVLVGEIKEGNENYAVSLSTLDKEYKFYVKYHELENMNDKIQLPQKTFTPFPKKGMTPDARRIEERRNQIQKWLKEVFYLDKATCILFAEFQIKRYGAVSLPSLTSPSMNIGTLYANTETGLQMYVPDPGKWTIAAKLSHKDSQDVYGERSLFFCEGSRLMLHYIPWGMDIELGDVKAFGLQTCESAAYHRGKVWGLARNNAKEAKLVGMDVRKNVWQRVTGDPPIIGYTCLVAAGDNVHILTRTSHHAYNPTLQTWTPLSTMAVSPYNTAQKFIAILAREFIFVYLAPELLRFNLNTRKWQPMPILPIPLSEVTHMVWDLQNAVSVWTKSNTTFCFDLDSDAWLSRNDLFVAGLKTLFCTFDFGEDQELDAEFEDVLLLYIMNRLGPWTSLYSTYNLISNDVRNILEQYEELGGTERIEFFRGHTEMMDEALNTIYALGKENFEGTIDHHVTSEVNRSLKGILLHLLHADPTIANYFVDIIYLHFHKRKRKDGSIFYVPNRESYQGKSVEVVPMEPEGVTFVNGSGVYIRGPLTINGVAVPTEAIKFLMEMWTASKNAQKTSSENGFSMPGTPTRRWGSGELPSTPTKNWNDFFPPSTPTKFAPSPMKLSGAYEKPITTTSTSLHNIYEGPVETLSPEEADERNAILQQLKERNVDISEHMLCPITQLLMFDPVTTMDGHTYEKVAIQKWFSQGNNTSPLTNQPLSSYDMVPAYALKNLIRATLDKVL